jgi:hypothetical protein
MGFSYNHKKRLTQINVNTKVKKLRLWVQQKLSCWFSYVHVFEPTSIEEWRIKKIQHCNFNRADKKTLQAINDAITAAAEEGKTSKFGGKIPPTLKAA